eukprot:TRINITY_DN51515_c0_g1_i1.p1 TRINITY_DN51515_c0_g1~~TRINITY_DN51515_c0_g1_i1.p1  ORF type:complete len:254 (-),score=83.63 TRINITY_DN51515_c0_g1_i1:179-829(-)
MAIVPEGKKQQKEEQEASPTSSDKQHKKGRGKGGKKAVTQQQMQDAYPLIIKTLLSLKQSVRTLEGINLECVLMPSDSEIVKEMIETGKDYGDAVRRAGKGHTFGPPHLRIFQAALEHLKGADTGAANKTRINKILEVVLTLEYDDQNEMCKVFRLKRCHDKKISKILMSLPLALSSEAVADRKSIINALVQIGGTHRFGGAPPDGAEHALSDLLG